MAAPADQPEIGEFTDAPTPVGRHRGSHDHGARAAPRDEVVHVQAFVLGAHSWKDRPMRAVIGRVKIKPDRADEALAMIGQMGVAMLRGMTGSAGGYWARSHGAASSSIPSGFRHRGKRPGSGGDLRHAPRHARCASDVHQRRRSRDCRARRGRGRRKRAGCQASGHRQTQRLKLAGHSWADAPRHAAAARSTFLAMTDMHVGEGSRDDRQEAGRAGALVRGGATVMSREWTGWDAPRKRPGRCGAGSAAAAGGGCARRCSTRS